MSTVALRSSGGWYVSAENGGGGKVSCDKQSVEKPERFSVIPYVSDDGGMRVYIRASNGQYLCAENGGGGDVNANRDAANIWETFTRVDTGGGKFAFKTHDGHFLRANGGGGGSLDAGAREVNADTQFQLEYQPFVWKGLEVGFTGNFTPVWTDAGSGAHEDGSFWHPSSPTGWFPVGDICVKGHEDPTRKRLVAIVHDASGDALRPPTEFQRVWDDSGSGADRDCSVWRPVPPAGYVAMGCVAMLGYDPPPLTHVRCVRQDLVSRGSVNKEPIWTDRGSGADRDFSAWLAGSLPATDGDVFVSPGSFLAVEGYDPPESHPCGWVFKLGVHEQLPRRKPSPPPKLDLAPGQLPAEWGEDRAHHTIHLPWYAVRDPGMSDVERMVRSPVYRVEREDRYHLLGVIDNRENAAEQSETFEYVHGFSHTDAFNFSETTKITLSWKTTVEAGVRGIDYSSVEFSTSISQSFSYGMSTKDTTSTSDTKTVVIKASPGKLVAAYVVKGAARMFRQDGTMVANTVNGHSPDKLVYYEI